MEANSSLMKRFDESRVELEKVLRLAQNCLTERGNPEELLKKHTVRKLTLHYHQVMVHVTVHRYDFVNGGY